MMVWTPRHAALSTLERLIQEAFHSRPQVSIERSKKGYILALPSMPIYGIIFRGFSCAKNILLAF